jgi:hypothetical protein
MHSSVQDYHTLHHLTHIALTGLAYHSTARLQYLLLTVFSFKSSYSTPLITNGSWKYVGRSNPTTYGYELPVTDENKVNKQYTKNVRLQSLTKITQ